ncbi:hypothetical protein Ga0100231_020540 [Opitutaceae bacterium TAV4]|nr:hypothetical protein Ga0100231_020540 [Opitutaceae bacterium TAV4]
MLDIRRSPPPPPPLPAVEVPSLYVTAPGRFEIVALDPRAGNAAIQWGTLAWETLRRPLALPEAYPDAIRVRLIPAAQWSAAPSDPDTAPSPDIQTTAEANGFVSVRIRLPDTTAGTGATGKEDDDLDLVIRRGLVQGLLLRQAIAWHGAAVHARLPRWLEYAGAQLMLERAIPAMYDAWRQQATALPAAPPRLPPCSTGDPPLPTTKPPSSSRPDPSCSGSKPEPAPPSGHAGRNFYAASSPVPTRFRS